MSGVLGAGRQARWSGRGGPELVTDAPWGTQVRECFTWELGEAGWAWGMPLQFDSGVICSCFLTVAKAVLHLVLGVTSLF